MQLERNDCHGDESDLELLGRKPERDPDADRDDFDWSAFDEELSAQYRNEALLSATPEQFRHIWSKL